MSDIKYSKTLDKILKKAAEIGAGEDSKAAATAERFIVAAIDETEKESAEEFGETYRLGELLKEKFGDTAGITGIREKLMVHINDRTKASYMDSIYMKMRLEDAKRYVSQHGDGSVVTSEQLLTAILNNPSSAIREALGKTEDKKQTEDFLKGLKLQKPENIGQNDTAESSVRKTEGEKVKEETADEEELKGGMKKSLEGLVDEVKILREKLKDSIYGQDNAINVFATGYFQAKMLYMIDPNRKRPRATFLLAGPPGVGKTYLAEKAAEALKLPFKRFDMSEYADKEANLEFCGSDEVYKNGHEGNVTSFVSENPECVLLFDEIEKAHLTVIHLFLQMLDAGRLRDNHTDEEVSFSKAIIIFTTNAGKQLYDTADDGDFSLVSRKVIINALQTDCNPETNAPYFPAAMCSRFASGNVVMFNRIGAHELRTIAKNEIQRHAGNFEKVTDIKLDIDESVYTALLFSEGSNADARTIRGRAESFFNDELYELLRLISSEKAKSNIEDIENIRVTIDLDGARPEIKELFGTDETARILVFADGEMAQACREKLTSFDTDIVSGFEEAGEAVKKTDYDMALLDLRCNAAADTTHRLNIEDVESPARDLLRFLREYKSELPVYLLGDKNMHLTQEELVSFTRQGVRGELTVGGKKDGFAERVKTVAAELHQQASMMRLAKENKLIVFETAQTLTGKGRNAEIKLFDFRMTVAVDPEDTKNVLNSVSKPNVRFEDVIGAEDAKKELEYFIRYLRDPRKFMGTGVKAPRGVLMYGPPGTGKTMLAKATACESDVTFIAAEGNQFLKKYLGEGPQKVHELFRTARKYAPSILFIDEIDAIAKERGRDNSTDGMEATLTSFLTEMDGFSNSPSKPVFVLAATNYNVDESGSKRLDPALMRRFDRRVFIDLPKKEDRIKFFRQKITHNQALDISETQIENLAVRSTGMSLAQLDSVFELALRSAIRNNTVKVNDSVLEEAFETFNYGEEKKWDISQLERVARHEAGHAFISWYQGETPSYLTIVARGDHGGYMQHDDNENKAIYTRSELLDRITTALGGRAAEMVYYGDEEGVSTGASGDLINATSTAKRMVCTYGMDGDTGLAVVNDLSGSMGEKVNDRVNAILKEQMAQAVKIISANKDKMDSLVSELMEKNHMGAKEIEAVLGGNKKPVSIT